METILIATDFSSAAHNATLYGVELAKSIRAKVIVFTAYQPSLALPDSALYVSPEELKKSSYALLETEANSIADRQTLDLELQSQLGPVNRSILDAAAKNKASYIIVGMKDHGKEMRKYLGTEVTQLCKTSTIPVIVVPANGVFSDPQKIALASDISDDADYRVLDPLKRIAENFDSHLFIVRVVKEPLDEVEKQRFQLENLDHYLSNIAHYYKFVKAEHVADGMNEFVREYRVNMVAVMPQEHGIFERIFFKSVTKELVFKCNVPILVLPGSRAATKATSEAGAIAKSNLIWSIY